MRVALSLVIGLVFVVALVVAVLRESAVECEVCVAFGSGSACRTSSAADRAAALQMAQSTACAVLADGVTDGLRCQHTAPTSVRCEGEAARP